MADTDDDFRGLMQRIREGSEEAAWELVDRYGERIRHVVRRMLNQRLRSKFDSLDFVQLVWSSFFRAGFQPGQFQRPEQLAAFLLAMARNKVGMEVRRRLGAEKYNLNREAPLDEGKEEVSGSQPTPVEVVIARERWNRMLQDQPEHGRRIIELRLQGYTCQEIADSLHLAERTVRRFLKRLETVA